jgi:hypothetical protein
MGPKRQADYSQPSNAEVKNEWSYTSTPHIHLTAYIGAANNDIFYPVKETDAT